MRVALSPRENLPHLPFLRAANGAYEWWYFDAVSADARWSLACIWFLGNPFSPFYRLAAQHKHPDALAHNALFFALYERGRLHAYHFTRFAVGDVDAENDTQLALRFGPNTLVQTQNVYALSLFDENANRRTLRARLLFTAPKAPDYSAVADAFNAENLWHPAAPSCAFRADITLRGLHAGQNERVLFTGHGYHDHNRGILPFASSLRDWYWARALMADNSTIIAYHVRGRGEQGGASHLLRFADGALVTHDSAAQVSLSRPVVNAFGRVYFTRMNMQTATAAVRFALRERLDSAPFYVRARAEAHLTENGQWVDGAGIGEWFAPHGLSSALAASATKARIVDRS